MINKSYAVSLIVDDKKNVIGAHVIDLKLPNTCVSPKEIPYSFRDVYDKKDIKNIENLDIIDGKIVTIHGSKDVYNLLQINPFGHMLSIKDNAIIILYKVDDKYVCIDSKDGMYSLSYTNLKSNIARGGVISNAALDTVRETIRPKASKGYTHEFIEVDVENDGFKKGNKHDSINEALAKWLFAPKARVCLLDIDGTITDKNGAVPPQMLDTLRKVNSLPNTFVILSTGRILEHELSKSINSEIVALGNGTLIFYKGKLVSSLTLDTNEALKVADFAEKKGYACQAYEPERRLIIQRKNSYQHDDPEAKNPNNNIMIVNKHTYDDVDKTPKMLIAVSPELTKQVQEEVKQIVDLSKCNVMITTKTTVEIVPKGVDKELSLRQICKFLGIEPKEIIAVGDNNNDIPMLKAAGLSFGVANSSDLVKQTVTKVLPKPLWWGSNDLMNTLIRIYDYRVRSKGRK